MYTYLILCSEVLLFPCSQQQGPDKRCCFHFWQSGLDDLTDLEVSTNCVLLFNIQG